MTHEFLEVDLDNLQVSYLGHPINVQLDLDLEIKVAILKQIVLNLLNIFVPILRYVRIIIMLKY